MTASDGHAGHPRESPQRDAWWSVWTGEVTWRQVAALRERLFDEMDASAGGLCLDVRGVTGIDRTGVALLIGANHRAWALGRPLELLDEDGPVTEALRNAHALSEFGLVQSSGLTGPPPGTHDDPSSN
jgi:anti-anti-sigma regulatory factor